MKPLAKRLTLFIISLDLFSTKHLMHKSIVVWWLIYVTCINTSTAVPRSISQSAVDSDSNFGMISIYLLFQQCEPEWTRCWILIFQRFAFYVWSFVIYWLVCLWYSWMNLHVGKMFTWSWHIYVGKGIVYRSLCSLMNF